MEWKQPAEVPQGNGKYWNAKKLEGSLVGIQVQELDDLPGYQGEVKPTIVGKVTVFDGDFRGDVIEAAEIQQAHLVRTLRKNIGEPVLGRLTKDGNSYVLKAPTTDEYKIAENFNADGNDSEEPPF